MFNYVQLILFKDLGIFKMHFRLMADIYFLIKKKQEFPSVQDYFK